MSEKLDLRVLLAGAAISIAVSDAAASEIAAASTPEARVKAFNALLEAGAVSAEAKSGDAILPKQWDREGFARDGNDPPDRADSLAPSADQMSAPTYGSMPDSVQGLTVSSPLYESAPLPLPPPSPNPPGFDRDGSFGRESIPPSNPLSTGPAASSNQGFLAQDSAYSGFERAAMFGDDAAAGLDHGASGGGADVPDTEHTEHEDPEFDREGGGTYVPDTTDPDPGFDREGGGVYEPPEHGDEPPFEREAGFDRRG